MKRCAWALLAVAAGCTETTVLSTRHTLARDTRPGEWRTTIQDETGVKRGQALVDLGATLRLDHDGVTMPVISPDGRFAAVQTESDAPPNVRLGDALPAQGMHTRIEAVSLEADTLGLPTTTLDGQWLLGRAATDQGFLVERPRADGGRDIALVPWSGGLAHDVVSDGWTNAFATVSPTGMVAWCRRAPEGGEWALVVQRNGVTRVLEQAPGDQWLFPSFAGDGSGIFALRLTHGALVVAWLPFEPDGLPSVRAALKPTHAVPLGLGANLAIAAQISQPASGLAASCPGSERIVLIAPGLWRAATWAPGGTLDPLADGSVAATLLDAETVLTTTHEMLGRQRLGDPEQRVEILADGPWIARPTTAAPSLVVVMRALNGRIELAHLDVRANAEGR